MTKAINRFDPVRTRSFEEAERHYVDVHHRYAREMHRKGDTVLQYVINRALRQYDVNGLFDQPPDAWRYVLHQRRDNLKDASAFISPAQQRAIWVDHTRCLRGIRGLEVEPDTVLDRCNGQMTFAKFLFEFHADEDVTIESGDRHYLQHHLPQLRELLVSAFGFRKCVTNRTLRQAIAEPLLEDGQVLTGEYTEPKSVYRIEEYWFDNAAWAGEFFASASVQALLRAPELGAMQGYLVEERCGVDKS